VKKFSLVFLVCVFPSVLFAWGGTGHKMINRNAVMHLPESMRQLIGQKTYLEAHASDPDFIARIDTDHFIDIDEYPNFQNKILSLDSLKAVYGAVYVTNVGTLPWTTVRTLDSLTAQFRRGDWTKAYLTASYIGHWVGDGYQPLHLTKNYDGKLTGNTGIHSRYETKMLEANQSSILVAKDSVEYIREPLAFVFRYVDANTVYTDSIMAADTQSKAVAGSTTSALYLSSMWARAGAYTKYFIQQASVDLASFWYTAWVDAGLLYSVTGVAGGEGAVPERFALLPNYPNPFNPSTNLRFTIGSAQHVRVDVYDVLGRRVASLVDRDLSAGTHAIQWNAAGMPGGVYYCRMTAGRRSAVLPMVLQK